MSDTRLVKFVARSLLYGQIEDALGAGLTLDEVRETVEAAHSSLLADRMAAADQRRPDPYPHLGDDRPTFDRDTVTVYPGGQPVRVTCLYMSESVVMAGGETLKPEFKEFTFPRGMPHTSVAVVLVKTGMARAPHGPSATFVMGER